MNAIDTNILVYAHRREMTLHAKARVCVAEHAEGAARWAIPWPCVHEFLAIVTNPKLFKTPTPMDQAVAQVQAWRESPTLALLAEDEGYWEVLEGVVSGSKIRGGKVHDARIAALAVFHGVAELLTADRDFSRFPSLRSRNPLV